jgi:hypothetical protein
VSSGSFDCALSRNAIAAYLHRERYDRERTAARPPRPPGPLPQGNSIDLRCFAALISKLQQRVYREGLCLTADSDPQPARVIRRCVSPRSAQPRIGRRNRAATRIPNRRLVCPMVARSHSASVGKANSSRIRRTRSGIIDPQIFCSGNTNSLAGVESGRPTSTGGRLAGHQKVGCHHGSGSEESGSVCLDWCVAATYPQS